MRSPGIYSRLPIAAVLLVTTGCSTWYGPRIDAFDDGVETVVGANLTVWHFGHQPKEDVYGLAVAPIVPEVRSVTGVAAGLLLMGDEFTGLNVGVLDTDVDRLLGINVGGLRLHGESALDGINVGLVVGGGGAVRGITLAPLVFTPDRSSDLSGVHAGEALGVSLAGALIDYPFVTGLTASGVLRAREVRGIGIGAVFTDVRDRVVGLSIGAVNRTKRLKGIQIGFLNRVADRPWWCRWLPGLNVGWDDAEEDDDGDDGDVGDDD